MSLKKWLLLFFAAIAGCTALLMACNVLVDPFGVFGDRLLDWYEYDMTMNPRVAKIAYLDKNYEKYDSYVVGSSKSSSLGVETLDRYTGASFYNMTWYGGDLVDERDLVRYLIEHYTVKNIVLAVDPQDADMFNTEADPIKGNMHCKVDGSSPLMFYAKYLLANPGYSWDKLAAYTQRGYLLHPSAIYVARTGVYNKQLRDATPIGAMPEYLALENNVVEQWHSDLPYVEGALEAVADILAMCEESGVRLTVIGVPIQREELARYDSGRLVQFWTGLAELTDFYDFWGNNPVNGDIRYFYDTNHFRNDVGDMVLGYCFGDPDVYRPEGFGHLTTADNVEQWIPAALAGPETALEDYTAHVPILMYHSFTDDPSGTDDVTVWTEDFREQLEALREQGYHGVFYRDLIDYVSRGTPLPEKPILISIDDGYQNNLDLAVPVLEETGFCATVAVIGCSAGRDTYKDTGLPITPHFALEDAAEYVRRGVLDIQTHSYDMHQVPAFDGEDCRPGALKLERESDEDYVAALSADLLRAREELERALGVTCDVYTYPNGLHDTLSEVALHSLHIRVTVATDYGVNVLVKGLPQSLYLLKRINVAGGTAAGELTDTLERLLGADTLY